MAEVTGGRFRDEVVEFGGIVGENVDVESANPTNYHQVINDLDAAEPVTIDGKLFLHDRADPQPVVIVVPGSLGVGPNHRAHAQTLVEQGYGVFLLDPFGARAVTSTVANQTHYSFAASGLDVLASLRMLVANDRVDPSRVSAQGHSRGGSAVLTASMRRFADPVVGDLALAGCYAVYPWCGHVFRDASVGPTHVRSIIGDLDDWLSPQQAQGQIHAIASTGGEATIRVVGGAHHSFDRLQAPEVLEDASISPHAPTVFIEDDGAMDCPYFDGPSATLLDADTFVASMKAGHGVKGATIGSVAGQPELFTEDMLAFHRRVLMA